MPTFPRTLTLPPNVWRGDQLAAAAVAQAEPSGHAALDACLPGGGWPVGALSEVLLPSEARPEWPLVLPALAQAAARRPGQIVLVAPPCEPFAPALQAAGLPVQRLCWVQPSQAGGAQAAWACEQALRCRDVLAVLAWLPQARPEMLRRLNLAAAARGGLLWGFRPSACRAQPTPAPLRLEVHRHPAGLCEGLVVRVLKRRGPPVPEPLWLPMGGPAAGPIAAALAGARAAQAERRAQSSGAEPRHALDRLALAGH